MQKLQDDRRQVVPRWRPFGVAAKLKVLDSVGVPTPLKPHVDEIEHLIRDWRNNRTPFHAANLVDAAIVLDQAEIASEAAAFLVAGGQPGFIDTELARVVLGRAGEVPLPDTPPKITPQERYKRIAAYRRSLREQPWNPIRLVDLAREYSALGQPEPAERALVKAVNLAPDNRFVLRSASRFLMHVGRPDDAHRILRRAPSTQSDPWLLAAELVAANAAGGSSRWTKLAEGMIRSGSFDPRHTTELASALGTMAYNEGKRSKVRRLFEHALIKPTENSVAQAGWISRHMTSFEVPENNFSVPLAFEAKAWEAALDSRFREAVDLSWEWLLDEPFATRPASFGSYVASIALEDYENATRLAEAALFANPEDPQLILQLIYCVASQGKTDRAERLLTHDLPNSVRRNPSDIPTAHLPVFVAADQGLIAYRRNQFAQGKACYERAIALARDARDPALEAAALLNLIREEVRANPSSIVPWEKAEHVLKAFPTSDRLFYERFLERSRLGQKIAMSIRQQAHH
jgi:tetratricopeptide (TPR) repeat protein